MGYYNRVDHMFLKKSIAKLVLLLSPFIVAESAKAEQILYCVTELSTGFLKDEGDWRTANFEKIRFAMKVEGNFETVSFNEENYSCFDGGEFNGYYPIICKSDLPFSSRSLNIDKYSLRFVYSDTSLGGYASTDNEPDTDNMHAGKCNSF